MGNSSVNNKKQTIDFVKKHAGKMVSVCGGSCEGQSGRIIGYSKMIQGANYYKLILENPGGEQLEFGPIGPALIWPIVSGNDYYVVCDARSNFSYPDVKYVYVKLLDEQPL